MHAVSLQFKRLCRRIDMQYKQNMQNLETNTDRLCLVGILPRVVKKSQHCATITDEYTDGLCPVGIVPRVAKQLQHGATITDDYTDRICLVVILLRVAKKL